MLERTDRCWKVFTIDDSIKNFLTLFWTFQLHLPSACKPNSANFAELLFRMISNLHILVEQHIIMVITMEEAHMELMMLPH